MGANFVSASSQHLNNAAPPISTFPFTVGMWVRPADVSGDKFFWTVTTSGGDYAGLMRISAQWVLEINFGGINIGTAVTNSWSYLVFRFISATNRRLSVLEPTGLVAQAQQTDNIPFTGINAINIGGSAPFGLFWDGTIAEYFLTNTDIQPDGAAIQDGLIRQLAYGGPFSVPSVVPGIVEYRSFFSSQGSDTDKLGEVYWGGRGRQTWTNTNGVRTGLHPPLPYSYVRPGQNTKTLVI